MSIVRIGLAETKHFSEGWDAIFSKKKGEAKKPSSEKAQKPGKSKKKNKKKS